MLSLKGLINGFVNMFIFISLAAMLVLFAVIGGLVVVVAAWLQYRWEHRLGPAEGDGVDVVIVGAGISGLQAAYQLQKAGITR